MRILIIASALSLTVLGCKKPEDVEFDRKAMLTEMYTNVISIAYSNMANGMVDLDTKADLFVAAPGLDQLTDLRNSYLNNYLLFQHIKALDFGPAGDIGLKAALNTYPTDSVKIKNNIASGTYTLGSAGNVDAIGFPALDYLLFSGSDIEVLNRFNSDENATEAQLYLTDIIDKMKSEISTVQTTWQDTYQSTFINADGTDVGSSIGLMFNEFVKDLELVKNAKIGIPAGQFSGGETFPTYVEAYYSGHSQALAKENLSALKNLFKGGVGLGYDDYMNFVDETEDLPITAADIEDQFEVCISKVSTLGNPFSDDIPTNFSGFSETFQELKKLVAYAKTDLSAALGVLITFSDTDGD